MHTYVNNLKEALQYDALKHHAKFGGIIQILHEEEHAETAELGVKM